MEMGRLFVLTLFIQLAACGSDSAEPGPGPDDNPPPYDPPPHVPPCEVLGLPSAPLIEHGAWKPRALRDVDGDGRLDVVLSYSDSVGVSTGNGDATFQPITSSPIGGTSLNYIKSAAIADLDGDGKLDVVLANDEFMQSAVVVMLGTGAGAFSPGTRYPTDAAAAVALADLNGDGKPDVVLAGPNASTVKVRLNNGDGTLGAELATPVGASPTAVAVADLDGDGKLDVIVANSADATVSILRGNGDGTFRAKVDRATAANPREIIAADLNGDGKLDLVVGGAQQISVLVNNGSGTLLDHVDYAAPAPTSAGSPFVVGDINRDGKLDVVYDGMLVLAGNGDGTLQPAVSVHVPRGGLPLALGDVNGDNALDVMVESSAWTGGSSIDMLETDGSGGFRSIVNYAMGAPSAGLYPADLDHDGYVDLVLMTGTGISIALGKPAGMFHDLVPLSAPSGPVGLVRDGDFDGDGVSDLLVQSNDMTGVVYTVLFGNGDGTFRDHVVPAFVLPAASAIASNEVALGDLDGDGETDIVVTNFTKLALFLSNGDGSFRRIDIDSCGVTNVFHAPTLGDFNGDGRLDVVATYRQACIECIPKPSGTDLLLNQGNGVFQTLQVSGLDSVAADLDGDGKVDLFQRSNTLLGNGDGTFQPPRPTGIPASILAGGLSGQLVDVTGDGKLDFAMISLPRFGWYQAGVRIFPGAGDGTFAAPLVYPVATDYGVFADVNHDGRLDLVTPGNTFDVAFARCLR